MKILYFAPIYYDDMKQRPQQIAQCLAQKHEVYYIEPTISLVRWLLKRGKTYRGHKEKIGKHLTCIRLNGMFTFHKSIEIMDFMGINNLSEYIQIKKLAETCDVIWSGYSGWYTLIRHLKGRPVVFDKMDEEDLLVRSRLLKMTLKRNKRKMLEIADLAFVTCMKFYEEISGQKKTCLVRNAVSKSFAAACADTAEELQMKQHNRWKNSFEKENTGQKIIFGYIGTIGGWFDFEAVRRILNMNQNHYIVLAGRNLQRVWKHKRVIYLGIRPHEQLPELIRSFDVCLYNFKKNELLDTINPVKIYEYLAAQKPVLSVSSMETRTLEKYIMLYEKPDEIPAVLTGGIRQPFSSKEEYMEFTAQNNWTKRAEDMEQALEEIVRKGRFQ